jgi:hypothetical protein
MMPQLYFTPRAGVVALLAAVLGLVAGPALLQGQTAGFGPKQAIKARGPKVPAHEAWITNLAVVDLNGDGSLDVLYTNEQDQIAWYPNQGQDKFGTPRVIKPADTSRIHSLATADLDRDGAPEVLFAAMGDDEPGKVGWYKNLGNGHFGRQNVLIDQAESPRSLRVADWTGNGQPDIVVELAAQARLIVLINPGPKGEWQRVELAQGIEQPIATRASPSGTQLIARRKRDGAFIAIAHPLDSLSAAPVLFQGQPANYVLCVKDLDGRNGPDLLTGWAAYDSLDGLRWYPHREQGHYGPAQTIVRNKANIMSLATADLDQDGDEDLVAGGARGNSLAWYENLGGGTFSAPRVLWRGGGHHYVTVRTGDLNGDGAPDLVVADTRRALLAWYENRIGN